MTDGQIIECDRVVLRAADAYCALLQQITTRCEAENRLGTDEEISILELRLIQLRAAVAERKLIRGSN